MTLPRTLQGYSLFVFSLLTTNKNQCNIMSYALNMPCVINMKHMQEDVA